MQRYYGVHKRYNATIWLSNGDIETKTRPGEDIIARTSEWLSRSVDRLETSRAICLDVDLAHGRIGMRRIESALAGAIAHDRADVRCERKGSP